jgi:hypothetical protein
MKYYVSAGELNVIVQADSPSKACHKAVTFAGKKEGYVLDLGDKFYVDERGFRPDKSASVILNTQRIMEKYASDE